MQRRSSRGNPWHDELGKFTDGPRAFLVKNGYEEKVREHFGKSPLKVSREELEGYIAEMGLSEEYEKSKVPQSRYEGSDGYYEARTKYRNGEIEKEEMEKEISDQGARKPYSFTPAKTMKEAKEYTKSLGVTPYFKGFDLETANAVNESLTQTFEEFPKTRKYVHAVGNAQEMNRRMKKELTVAVMEQSRADGYNFSESLAEDVASSAVGRINGNAPADYCRKSSDVPRFNEIIQKYNGIRINENNCNHYAAEAVVGAGVAQKFHPEGCTTTKSLIDHECGHVIDDAYGISEHAEPLFRENEKDMKERLSEYAARNVREFIAEGYCEYRNNPKPRPLAMQIFETIKENAK